VVSFVLTFAVAKRSSSCAIIAVLMRLFCGAAIYAGKISHQSLY